MNKKELILIGLIPASNEPHSPVQIQKLFFLIDRNVTDQCFPKFDFQPYNYGPFDKEIYDVLRELFHEGLVNIINQGSWSTYQLTEKGIAEGQELFEELPIKIQQYISDLSNFVRGLSFSDLVSAIYKAYPEMRINSVFQE